MDKKKFEEIDNYLNAADKNLARKELITISQTCQHDPDYLYLRAKLLKFDQKMHTQMRNERTTSELLAHQF